MPIITISLIIITVGISFLAWNKPAVYEQFLMNPYKVKRRLELHRFITSGFIHADYGHLFFNMFSLFLFGKIIEENLSPLFYISLYLLAIIVSEIPTYLKNHINAYYNSLGASGGVAAVVFSAILLDPIKMEICIFFGLCVTAFIYGFLFLLYSYIQGKRGGDNINHDAHFYGALFGVIFTIIVYPEVLYRFLNELQDWGMF